MWPSGYSSSASARAVREEGLQCTGLRPLQQQQAASMQVELMCHVQQRFARRRGRRSARAGGWRRAQGAGSLAITSAGACHGGSQQAACAASPVDVAVEHHLAKHPQLSGLVGRLQGDVRRIPVGPHAVPAAGQGCTGALHPMRAWRTREQEEACRRVMAAGGTTTRPASQPPTHQLASHPPLELLALSVHGLERKLRRLLAQLQGRQRATLLLLH